MTSISTGPTPRPAMLDATLRYAARGRRVLPTWWLRADGSCGCGGLPSCRPGKHPITRHGVRDATTDAARITAWWTAYPEANVAMAMGDGVVAIDVDPRNGGDATLAAIVEECGALPRTPTAKTGGGGWHYFVEVEGEFHADNAWKERHPGIDLIGDGKYVLAAPSRTAGPYAWIVAPWDAPLAMAPRWVLDAQKSLVEVQTVAPLPAPVGEELARLVVRARAYLATMAPAISGSGGHAATWRAALALVQGFGLPSDVARQLLDEYNRRCVPPWSAKELEHKIKNAAKASRVPPHWLASSPGETAGQWGAALWRDSIHAVVRRAVYEPPPTTHDNRATSYRVRLEVERLTADGELVRWARRRYVTIPDARHPSAAALYEATLGDIPPEAWAAAYASGTVRELEASVEDRWLEIVVDERDRTVRMRRAPC